MAMRGLFWLALLFIVAVALAVAGRFDHGYVVIVYPPYRIDVSLNLVIVAIVLGFIVLYALIRGGRNVWKMPSRVAAYRARSRAERSRMALRDAVSNLYAGRFSRAEKAARTAAALPENRDAAGLIGASAAHRMHEYVRRDDWLAAVQSPDWSDARLLASAEMRVDARDAEGALAALGQVEAQGGRRIHAQLIALRAHQQLEHWSDVLRLVKALEKRDAIHAALALRLKQLASENLLRDRRHDADALLETWHTLPVPERYTPRIADLAAALLLELERPAAARRIVEESLEKNWNARVVRRYGECAGTDPLPLIQRAEIWLAAHPEDPDLLFALGRLCVAQRLWGKAQSFLDAALALADDDTLTIRIHRTLARMHEALGNATEAGVHFRASAMAVKLA